MTVAPRSEVSVKTNCRLCQGGIRKGLIGSIALFTTNPKDEIFNRLKVFLNLFLLQRSTVFQIILISIFFSLSLKSPSSQKTSLDIRLSISNVSNEKLTTCLSFSRDNFVCHSFCFLIHYWFFLLRKPIFQATFRYVCQLSFSS